MFGMGFTEILLIAIVAILFLGPEKLPNAMVQIAKFIKGAKSAITEAKSAIDSEVKISELKEEALSYKSKLESATDELQGFKNLNPLNDLNETFEGINDKETTTKESVTTQVEPKQDATVITKKKNSAEEPTKKGDA
ncbi:MAG: Sec-independent protein translocase protein TatB [Epsilonproteobacteria bacterium]|nr:Sec-independent protein translocase protein TatB [Campylobacterota bacterium]